MVSRSDFQFYTYYYCALADIFQDLQAYCEQVEILCNFILHGKPAGTMGLVQAIRFRYHQTYNGNLSDEDCYVQGSHRDHPL